MRSHRLVLVTVAISATCLLAKTVIDYDHAVNFLVDWLEKHDCFVSLRAIGHRIVHGMEHTGPEQITPELLEELKKMSTYDPDHLPGEIKMIDVFSKRYPALAQIACFDTSSNLLEALNSIAGSEKANGRVILAHLDNVANLAAVKDGKSIDTSTSDLDSSVAWYLMQIEKLTQGTDGRAAEAMELFCYQTKKWIGSFAAVLGGIDTLIFSGGIGENAPEIRARICNGLEFLGMELEEQRNLANANLISTDAGRVAVRIVHTDEEYIIARTVCRMLNLKIEKEQDNENKKIA